MPAVPSSEWHSACRTQATGSSSVQTLGGFRSTRPCSRWSYAAIHARWAVGVVRVSGLVGGSAARRFGGRVPARSASTRPLCHALAPGVGWVRAALHERPRCPGPCPHNPARLAPVHAAQGHAGHRGWAQVRSPPPGIAGPLSPPAEVRTWLLPDPDGATVRSRRSMPRLGAGPRRWPIRV